MRVDRLEAAGQVRPVWLPFELHPDVPPEGMPRSAYFPPGRRERAAATVAAMAAEVGLTMRTPERMVNSRRALATAEFARERGAFETVHRALFRLHWEGPGALDDVEELKRLVGQAGLVSSELEDALAEGRYDGVVDATRREAIAAGVDAVPAHVFGRRFLLVGAHPDELYQRVLRRLAELPGES